MNTQPETPLSPEAILFECRWCDMKAADEGMVCGDDKHDIIFCENFDSIPGAMASLRAELAKAQEERDGERLAGEVASNTAKDCLARALAAESLIAHKDAAIAAQAEALAPVRQIVEPMNADGIVRVHFQVKDWVALKTVASNPDSAVTSLLTRLSKGQEIIMKQRTELTDVKARLEQAESANAALRGNQRTAGTVEQCSMCWHLPGTGGTREKQWADCHFGNCPIRQANETPT